MELGITGKLALWRALIAAAEVAALRDAVDYQRLARRATEQIEPVELRPLEAAKAAHGAPPARRYNTEALSEQVQRM